jgi:LCP family protein required for cell wall assembly
MANDKNAYDIHRNLPPRRGLRHAKPADISLIDEPKQKFDLKKALVAFVLIIFLFCLTIGIWDAVALSRASQKMFGSGNLASFLGGDLAGRGGRTNILLMGYSVDDPGHAGATLTDSIMLMSLDNSTKSGYILSIPRDLYVKIPGFGYAKINEAYQDGERSGFSEAGLPPGGPGLLERVVSEKLAVPIDYYALINYAAFRDTVNSVGGITVNISSSDPRGLYDPNMRQQAVSWKVILNPIRAGHLFDGMAGNVKTDLDTGNVLPLFGLFNKVNANRLQSVGLRNFNGRNLLAGYGGALIPAAGLNDYSDIQAAISQLNQ